jgi:hypothetical protein
VMTDLTLTYPEAAVIWSIMHSVGHECACDGRPYDAWQSCRHIRWDGRKWMERQLYHSKGNYQPRTLKEHRWMLVKKHLIERVAGLTDADIPTLVANAETRHNTVWLSRPKYGAPDAERAAWLREVRP